MNKFICLNVCKQLTFFAVRRQTIFNSNLYFESTVLRPGLLVILFKRHTTHSVSFKHSSIVSLLGYDQFNQVNNVNLPWHCHRIGAPLLLIWWRVVFWFYALHWCFSRKNSFIHWPLIRSYSINFSINGSVFFFISTILSEKIFN